MDLDLLTFGVTLIAIAIVIFVTSGSKSRQSQETNQAPKAVGRRDVPFQYPRIPAALRPAKTRGSKDRNRLVSKTMDLLISLAAVIIAIVIVVYLAS